MSDAIVDRIQQNDLSIENIRRVFPDQAQRVSPEDLLFRAGLVQRSLEASRYRSAERRMRSRSDILGLEPGDLVQIENKFYTVTSIRPDGKFHLKDRGGAFSPNLLPVEINCKPRKWRLAATKQESDKAMEFFLSKKEDLDQVLPGLDC